MSRALLILSNQAVRQRAIHWIKNVPDGTRVEFKEPKRTVPQNDRMWAMLTEISNKALLGGNKYTADEWKCIFLDALGQEMTFLPKLYGQGFLPIGQRSSELDVGEMSQLMELMEAWCAQNGVTLTEPNEVKNGKI
ncbi:recombination protein NinB [uncultured Bartonella sp.]|uniref:recombination protein NinB n=1 Tax=uncultured Bartonella sp. TaxID=104108 RepID=UPI0025FC656F|nr:recombination protein NinB [uncultured Bartonella sp.]